MTPLQLWLDYLGAKPKKESTENVNKERQIENLCASLFQNTQEPAITAHLSGQTCDIYFQP